MTGVEITCQLCTVKGERPVGQTKKRHPPQSENQKLWGGRGGWKGEFTKPVVVGRLGTCLSMGAGRARMEHEKNGVGKGGKVRKKKKKRRRRWWWTDGRGLEVDGRQLAAGGLRELCQHAGQGPVLSLQPLFNLPQGLNLLYLGEVLQGGKTTTTTQENKEREGGREGGSESERMAEEEKRNVFQENKLGEN